MSHTEITDFILARLSEQAQVANRWPDKLSPPPEGHVFWRDTYGHPIHEPRSHVLAEVEVHRRIVELHAREQNSYGPSCRECSTLDNAGDPVDDWPCATIRLLATIWPDHPDYRAEWAPS